MADLRIRDSDGLFTGFGPAQAGETLTTIADASVPAWALPGRAWWIANAFRARPDTALQQMARTIHAGLHALSRRLAEVADFYPHGAVVKAHDIISWSHRAAYLVLSDSVTGKSLSAAQRLAWGAAMLQGPTDIPPDRVEEKYFMVADGVAAWTSARTWADPEDALRDALADSAAVPGTVPADFNAVHAPWIDDLED